MILLHICQASYFKHYIIFLENQLKNFLVLSPITSWFSEYSADYAHR